MNELKKKLQIISLTYSMKLMTLLEALLRKTGNLKK
jgi:hypothetical protein